MGPCLQFLCKVAPLLSFNCLEISFYLAKVESSIWVLDIETFICVPFIVCRLWRFWRFNLLFIVSFLLQVQPRDTFPQINNLWSEILVKLQTFEMNLRYPYFYGIALGPTVMKTGAVSQDHHVKKLS